MEVAVTVLLAVSAGLSVGVSSWLSWLVLRDCTDDDDTPFLLAPYFLLVIYPVVYILLDRFLYAHGYPVPLV